MDSSLFPNMFDGQSPRMLGVYPQRQDGLYMQRAKVRAGRLSPAQLRSLAEAARKFTRDYPLHLTTRQDVEFHGIHLDDIRRVQKRIQSAGLTCIGACGDSIRNITVCPGAGICPEGRDVAVAADIVKEALDAIPFSQNLPRKFKISFSGCEKACGLPFVNDLGFVYRSDGTYVLVGAGSLGPPPVTGLMLTSRLLGEEIVTAATAAVRLFYRLGNRRRHMARLRHVRERLGDEEFIKLFHEEFRRGKNSNGAASFSLPLKNGYLQITRLQFPFGDITFDQALQVADAVERADGEIRIDLQHGVWLAPKKAVTLPDELLKLSAHPEVICCSGAAWCSKGLTDCRSAAEAIAAKLKGKISGDLSVRISGCPDNCTMPAVADIGLIGRLRSIDGARRECYKLVAGGGAGKTDELAIPLASAVTAEQIPQVVEWLKQQYGLSKNGLTFTQFIRLDQDRLKRSLTALISSSAFQER